MIDCPYCGKQLTTLGVTTTSQKYLSVEDGYSGHYDEENIGYFCPECDCDLDEKFGNSLAILMSTQHELLLKGEDSQPEHLCE